MWLHGLCGCSCCLVKLRRDNFNWLGFPPVILMRSFNEATCTPRKLMVQIFTLVFRQHSASRCVFFFFTKHITLFLCDNHKNVISSSLLTSVFHFYDFLYINIIVSKGKNRALRSLLLVHYTKNIFLLLAYPEKNQHWLRIPHISCQYLRLNIN